MIMRQSSMWALAVVVAAAPVAWAEKDSEYEALVKAYSGAQEKWFKKNKNPAKRNYQSHPLVEYMPRFKALVEAKPKTQTALDCMVWVLENCKFLRYTNIEKKEEMYAWAFKGLKSDFAADPRIEPKIREFIDLPFHYGPAALGEIYEAIIKDNPSKVAKAWAKVALGVSLDEYYGDLGPRNAQVRQANKKRAQELFKQVIDEDPNSPPAAEARKRVHSLNALSVGATAPEIVGKDAEGKEIKLSSFRGKVVVIDFWTLDCDSCQEFHETARELLKTYKDKPFVWLGVNADVGAVEAIKKDLPKEDITWPNILEGAERPISSAWNVDGYPTVFVVDHAGVIQRRAVDRQSVKLQVEALVSKVPPDAAKKPEDKPAASTPQNPEGATPPPASKDKPAPPPTPENQRPKDEPKP